MIFNSVPHACAVIDVFSDVWDRVFVTMSLEVWTMDVWDDVILASLTAVPIRVDVDMLMDVEITVLIVVVILLAFDVVITLEFAMSG